MSLRLVIGTDPPFCDASVGVEEGVSTEASPATLDCCEVDDVSFAARLLMGAAVVFHVNKELVVMPNVLESFNMYVQRVREI